MSSANQVDVVLLIEILDNNFAKGVRNSAIVFTPINYIFFWVCRIRPQQIAKKTRIRHIGWPQNLINLLKIIKLWRKTSVNAENFVVDNGSYWEAIEALNELFPKLKTISALALIVETVNSVN